WNLLLEQHG
ncbi:hypothetical protein A2U01_0054899, partial [Trifolium medium]|nr:hypothetical protein [Trifolium medium]